MGSGADLLQIDLCLSVILLGLLVWRVGLGGSRQHVWLLPSALEMVSGKWGRESNLLTVLRQPSCLTWWPAPLQHNKSSQWCQEHFLNYKGLVRAATVREQLKKLLVKFQVPKMSSEGGYGLSLPVALPLCSTQLDSPVLMLGQLYTLSFLHPLSANVRLGVLMERSIFYSCWLLLPPPNC